MKRLAIKLVLFLLLGTIINVAVAWGCAGFLGFREFDVRIITNIERRWVLDNAETPGSDTVYVYRGIGVRWDVYNLYSPMADEARRAFEQHNPEARVEWDSYECTWFSSGLPFHSVGSAYWVHTPDWGATTMNAEDGGATVETRGGWPISDETSMPPMISYCPIWPGFAINTIFYAAVLWIVFAAPGFVKRRIRRFRGRCIHCGYDLRGHIPGAGAEPGTDSVKCPECGRKDTRLAEPRP